MRLMRHSISRRRATVLILIVGLLAMLFMLVSAYITLARFDRVRTRQISSRDERLRILESTQDLLVSTVAKPQDVAVSGTAQPLSESEKLVSGVNYPVIPGSIAAPWLAPLEPVRNPLTGYGTYGPNGTKAQYYTWPNVSSLNGTPSGQKTVAGLMLKDPNAILPAQVPGSDARTNARRPFADATGAGVNDAGFVQSALATEMANAIAGVATRADFDPTDPNANVLSQQFERTARYQVPVRIISHGGMVLLSDPNAWNGLFLRNMFNWVSAGVGDPQMGSASDNDLRALGSLTAVVEPALRARGSMLVSAGGSTSLPPALRNLQDAFPNTFLPRYSAQPFVRNFGGDWQRFNLAVTTNGYSDWDIYRYAGTFDASAYNATAYGTGANPKTTEVSNRRRYLTGANRSDDLAWNLSTSNDADPNALLRPGAPKFYLGDIARAFNSNGRFLGGPTGAGTQTINELRQYFQEMISQHKLDDDPNEPVGERDVQAAMLAANAVAFAAPQYEHTSSTWRNDVVAYQSPAGMWYFGYAPQPYITQVMAYFDPNIYDPNGPANSGRALALAVELYNPHESDYAGDVKHHIDLSQFALSVGDNPTPVLIPLKMGAGVDQVNPVAVANPVPLPAMMRGRSFATVEVHSTAGLSNDFFSKRVNNGQLQPYQLNGTIQASQMPPTMGANSLTVRLWRLVDPNSNPTYPLPGYVVDEAVLDISDEPTSTDPNFGWWANLTRDMTPDAWVGTPSGVLDSIPTAPFYTPESRWRMTVAFNDPNDEPIQNEILFKFNKGDSGNPDPQPVQSDLYTLGNGYFVPSASFPVAPSVPLHTLNADSGTFTLYGTADRATRPRAYPTVGFMLFLSRYAHTLELNGVFHPVSWWLHKKFLQESEQNSLRNMPIDFGHMPVFDNRMKPESSGPLKDLGAVPWGLLVFDFFTTLDPAMVDQTAIDGRINVNAAPWYVLAGLPVIGPANGNVNGDILALKAGGGNPAFYSANSGVLTGNSPLTYQPQGVQAPQRYPLLKARNWSSSQKWWYLGAWRAQAAVAYRDQLQYTPTNSNNQDAAQPPHVMASANQRYDGKSDATKLYRIRDAYGELRNKPGFVSLGELLNVPGWDGSRDDELVRVPGQGWSYVPTVLNRGAYQELSPNSVIEPDYMRAVSLMALLDTHFLTTRSNTFTIYASLFDRTNPEASIRTQVTVDRTNVLPRRIQVDTDGNGVPDTSQLLPGQSRPAIIGQRTTNYYNARYDD